MGQTLLDSSHPDLRRARAASISMIPTTTGAAKSVGLVIPELDGKLDGQAIRVPVPNVSLLDISVELQKDTDIESLHDVFIKEGKSKMKGIVDVSCEPLVSVDYVGNTYSAVIDCLSTNVLNKRFVKMIDNGAVEEVKKLLKLSFNESLPVMKAHGVPEISLYLDKKIDINECINKGQQATRNYVKRQHTWWSSTLSLIHI